MKRPLTPQRLGWLVLLATLWGASSVWLVSDGAVAVAPDMLVLYVGAALVGMTMLGWVVAGSARRSSGPPDPRRRWPYYACAGLVVAVVPSLCRYGTPFKLRFATSRAALEAVARETPRGHRWDGSRWIGALRVDRIDTAGAATRFFTGTCELADRCGVVYSPEGEPPRVNRDRYVSMGGPWWAMAERR